MTDERFDLEKYLRLAERGHNTLSGQPLSHASTRLDSVPVAVPKAEKAALTAAQVGDLLALPPAAQAADSLTQGSPPSAIESSLPCARGGVGEADGGVVNSQRRIPYTGGISAKRTEPLAAPHPTLFGRLARWVRRMTRTLGAPPPPQDESYDDERFGGDGAEAIQPRQRRARRSPGASESFLRRSRRKVRAGEFISPSMIDFGGAGGAHARESAVDAPERSYGDERFGTPDRLSELPPRTLAQAELSPIQAWDRTDTIPGDNSARSAAEQPNGVRVSPFTRSASGGATPLDDTAAQRTSRAAASTDTSSTEPLAASSVSDEVSYADETRVADASPPPEREREWGTAAPSVREHAQPAASPPTSYAKPASYPGEAAGRSVASRRPSGAAPTLATLTRALERELRRYG